MIKKLRDQSFITLHEKELYSFREIAEQFDKAVSTVYEAYKKAKTEQDLTK